MKRIIAAASSAAIALLAAAALAAPAGADTVICSSEVPTCPSGSIMPAGSHVITGNAGNHSAFRIGKYGKTEFDCANNTMTAKSTEAIGNPLSAEFSGTLSSCRFEGKEICDGSMNQPPTTLDGSTGSEHMRIGTAAQPLTVSFVCGAGELGEFSCAFSATDTVDVEIDENEATVWMDEMHLTGGEYPPCYPSTSYLKVGNLTEGKYISQYTPAGSVLCKTAQEPCNNEANWYGSGTSLGAQVESGDSVTFTNPIHPTTCNSSSMTGQLTGSGGGKSGVPFEISGANFTGCSSEATVTAEGFPWTGTISDSDGIGNGVLNIPTARIKYFRAGLTCVYDAWVTAQIVGNSELVLASELMRKVSGGFLCGKDGAWSGSWSGTYGITAPSPFYVSWL